MGKIFAISDIHGHYDEFVRIIKKIKFQKGIDKLYILGDIVDRGPESIKLLSLIWNLQIHYPETVKVLRGNHDQEFLKVITMMSKGETYTEEAWNMYAGFTGDDLNTVDVFHKLFDVDAKTKLINWLSQLPYYIEDGPYIFVHAAINPTLTMDKQTEQTMLWGSENEKDPPFYSKKAFFKKVVIFGHTPSRIMHMKDTGKYNSHIWYDLKNYDKICIDCGIWSGGLLGVLEIDEVTDHYTEHYL